MKEFIFRGSEDGIILINEPQGEVVRCNNCVYAEHTMFDNEYVCYFDEENESGCKRRHNGNWFCADGQSF